MKQPQIKIQGSQLSISVRKAPLIIRVILTLVLAVLVLIPFGAIIFALIEQSGPHIFMAFMFFVFWGAAFYMLRVILWNSVGREVLTLNPDKIVYIADYKHFKDGRQEISTEDLEVGIIHTNESDLVGRLVLKSPTKMIQTVVWAPLTELEELITAIEMRYEAFDQA